MARCAIRTSVAWLLRAAAMGVGVSEAVLWFIRRWLVARATMGVEADIRKDLYARLQILPMSFHGRWQSGQLLSRIMNDLSTIRRFMSFGMRVPAAQRHPDHRGDRHPAGGVLAAGCGRAAVDRADRGDGAALPAEYTRLSRLAQDQSGHVATHVEESALGLRVVKSFGREDYVYDRFDEQLTNLYDTGQPGIGIGEVLDAARGHPEPDADHRARLRCVRGRPRLRHDGHTGRVHHDDAVAGLADRIAWGSCCR